MTSEFYKKIYEIIAQIPTGKVATYGQIAILAGKPHAARAVGWALNQSPPERDLPWHRVISATGRSSLPEEAGRRLQHALLRSEGVQFDANGRVNFDKYLWNGKARR